MEHGGDCDSNLGHSTEQAPLIPSNRHADAPRGRRLHAPREQLSGNTILQPLCAVLFLAALATGLVYVPLTRIVEDAVCRQYYHYGHGRSLDEPVDEQLCKLQAIQSKVAFIFALVSMSEGVIALFAALPWGIVADRIGRKPVFSIALMGLALGVLFMMVVLRCSNVFPTAFVALGPVFYVIGGGNAVAMGILLSMISNVIPDDQRAVAFMRLQVSGLVGSLVSPALSSAMMAVTGPWPVMLLAVACLLAGAVSFVFVPETVPHKTGNERTGLENQTRGFKEHLIQSLAQLKESLSILNSPSLFLLILTCLGTAPFSAGVLQFLGQFVSKRYGLLIKDTGYIQTAYGVLHIFQALIVLPWISSLLLRYTTPSLFKAASEPQRDIILAKWSFWSSLLGFLTLGAAPNLATFILGLIMLAIGSCYNSLIRSLISLYVAAKYQSSLFSLVGTIEIIGSLYGSPMIAGLFTLGMRIGGGWIGLPYYGLAALCALCIGVLHFVRVPKDAESEQARPDEG